MNAPLSAQQLAAVRDTVRSGNKIGAIKLYREYTAAGLAEAKEAVENIEAGLPIETVSTPAPADLPVMPEIQPERWQWIHEALFKGNKVEAIRLFRDGTNWGLKDSKEAMDKLEADLRRQSPEKFAASAPSKGCLGMLLVLGGLVATGAAMWWLR